jgi:hypothetical protein
MERGGEFVPMKRISIAGIPVEVAVLGFGCTGLGSAIRGDAAVTLVSDYLAAGGNHFDTAHCYGFWTPEGVGSSERELGRIIHELGCRDEVVVVSKGGHPEGDENYRRPNDFLNPSVLLCDIENSLYRLGVETIDLYYLHRDDGKTPVSKIIDTLNAFIQKGWVRALGASNWSTARMAEANAYAAGQGLQGFVISQIQGSLAVANHTPTADPTHRPLDSETIAWHRETKMPVAAFSATANGYFADNPSPSAITFYDNPVSQGRRARARELAAQLGVTPVQIAFAYLLHEDGFPILPLFSTTSPRHLAETLASDTLKLTMEQVRYLRDSE